VSPVSKSEQPLIAFLAHSFSSGDKALVSIVSKIIKRTGMKVLTGERPEAKTVGQKVRRRIDSADLFIGLLTRRHSIRDGELWTTSPWVVEEKGYSIGQKPARPIILLIENGILVPSETGGLEGDLEFIEFRRHEFELVKERLREVLALETARIRSRKKSRSSR
jgi:hypothetical protein